MLDAVGDADAYARIWGGIAYPWRPRDRLEMLIGSGPRLLYEPVLLDDGESSLVWRGGAFPTEVAAQKVLDTWSVEGRAERMVINLMPLYQTAAQWEIDR